MARRSTLFLNLEKQLGELRVNVDNDELYFDKEKIVELKQKENCYKRTIEKAHSNIEIREYYITEDISWISQKKNGQE